MSKGVVDYFESHKFENKQSDDAVFSSGSFDCIGQLLLKERGVGQARQGVEVSKELKPLGGAPAFGNVLRGAFEMLDLPGFIAHSAQIERDPFCCAISAKDFSLDADGGIAFFNRAPQLLELVWIEQELRRGAFDFSDNMLGRIVTQNASHHSVDAEELEGRAELKHANRRFFKHGSVLVLVRSERLDRFLVVDEEPINGVESLMPEFFNRAGTSALAKQPRTGRDAHLCCLILREDHGIKVWFRAAICLRFLYDPSRKHKH
jgi:hypothetical protein